MSRQLLRLWCSHPLPTLRQGGTLSVLSNVEQTKLCLSSEWRNDGHVSLLQSIRQEDKEAQMILKQEQDRMTSLGRAESHISIYLNSIDDSSAFQHNDPQGKEITGDDNSSRLHVVKNCLLEDIKDQPSDSELWPPRDGQEEELGDCESVLTLKVPEKVNIECNLLMGGSIFIDNKIEGDVKLLTTDGNIYVKKLRGHSIVIEAGGRDNSIYASDLLEARRLDINLPHQGRVRAKKIHANSVSIQIGSDSDSQIGEDSSNVSERDNMRFDDDDAGSLCDISSMYLSGEANIKVQAEKCESRAVRIKSNHGPVIVDAFASKPLAIDETTGQTLPIVEMGGVNGSCEVLVTGTNQENDGKKDNDANWNSCRVHFDSMSPDTVSLVHVDKGDVCVTFDRKVESDIRLVSASSVPTMDTDALLVDDDDSEELASALRNLNDSSKQDNRQMISIKTKAFLARDITKSDPIIANLNNIEYVDGCLQNKSNEPDSRFDRKIKGDSGGGGGKIRLEGAAAQALKGFQADRGGTSSETDTTSTLPLVAIASPGKIVIETLSWLGNIARRYGLEDSRDVSDLGRTATRRGRDFAPTSPID